DLAQLQAHPGTRCHPPAPAPVGVCSVFRYLEPVRVAVSSRRRRELAGARRLGGGVARGPRRGRPRSGLSDRRALIAAGVLQRLVFTRGRSSGDLITHLMAELGGGPPHSLSQRVLASFCREVQIVVADGSRKRLFV